MTALVTGATGFLASRLLSRLLDAGHKVIAVSRGPIPTALVGLKALIWLQRDLSTETLLPEEIGGVDEVFHMAGATLGAGSDEQHFFAANEATTVHLLHACAGRAKKFVYASSQVVYGDADHLAVSEDFPVRGLDSAYACSKVNAENWMKWFQQRKGGIYVVLRLSGFVEGGGAIDYMIDQALAGKDIELFSHGVICRDYLGVQSGISALVGASEFSPIDGYYPFNIGTGEAVPMIDIARLVCAELGSSSKIVPVATQAPRGNFVFDIARARNELGFRPMALDQAVRQYARERRKQGLR